MRRLPLSLTAVLLLAALHMLVFDRGLGGDGWAGFALLESVADDGDLWLEDDHRGVMNGLVPGDESHLVSQYPPGVLALDALPFLAGRFLDSLLPAGILADGAELPPVGRVPRGVFLSAAAIVLCRNLAALLGVAWTGLALLRLGVPERTAALAAGLAFFGGPMIFYSLVGMTHAPTFALAGLLLWLLAPWRSETRNDRRSEPRPWPALAAGLTVGGAVLIRYSAVALLVPALLAVRGWRDRLLVLAGFGMPLLVLPVWWRLLFGAWGMPPYGGSWEITAASPWNVLFAPVHGLFLFHPALLLAVAGLILAVWRRQDLGWTCTAWFLAVAVLHGWWSEWANTGGYGQRFLGDALPALALGFAAWLQPAWLQPARRPAVRLIPCLAAVLAGWVLFFAAVGGLVPPPAPYPWPQRLGEYGVLLREPPGMAALGEALRRSSFVLRGLLSR
jgi:hypothetical protein